jgi:hypothetical protein
MRARRNPSRFHEPSLVPMADMLTNTVGVVLFILIFTVLTAGGAIVAKRLPMERETKAEPMALLCASGRIAPVDLDPLAKAFIDPIKPRELNLSNVDAFVTQFNSRKIERDGFVVTGEAQNLGFALRAVLIFRPGEVGGESAAALATPASAFRALLKNTDPAKKYANFIVYPDGLSTFRAARDLASAAGFGTGWTLYGANEPLRMCVASCGPSRGGRIM